MTESDDTDTLLNIPPTLFAVRSSSDEENALDRYSLQHHTLEFLQTDLILPERQYFTFPLERKRKTKRRRQSLSSSEKSFFATDKETYKQLCSNKNKCSNDTESMDGDISSIVSSPSKKNDKLFLNEIDEFLHEVEGYESIDAKSKEVPISPEHVIRATGDYMSHKFQCKSSDDAKLPMRESEPVSVLDKYIYLNRTPTTTENRCKIQSANESSNIKELDNQRHSQDLTRTSCELKSPLVRRLFSETNKDVQSTSTPKRNEKCYTNYIDFRPSINKVYDGASKVLEQHKTNYNRLECPASSKLQNEDFKVPSNKFYNSERKVAMETCKSTQKFIDTIDTDLLSLSSLWGAKGDKMDSGKFEEEKLKREHCELMIQDLQKKLLEQQEKLAVAIKVDRAKDMAINKLREGWLKVTGSLERSETLHRVAMDKMAVEVEHYKLIASNAQKKTEHFEAELYKALDLAHDYQDKCRQLSKERSATDEDAKQQLLHKEEVLNAKNGEFDNLKDNYETLMTLNKQAGDCIKKLESSLAKEQLEHNNTKAKLLDLDKKTENIHSETTLLLQERDVLKEKLKEERARNSMLEKQLADKLNMCSAVQKREDSLDNEILSLKRQIELQKDELKCHYQKQLEDAVLAKLHEFQQQLDEAEREIEKDARVKEMAIVDTYNKQVARVEDQHKLEINILEEKQREEVKLYRLQLAQAGEKITLLESKLDSYRRRRSQIAAQLHSVMESQWRQAMHILTTPSVAHSADTTHAWTPVPQESSRMASMPTLPTHMTDGRQPVRRRDYNVSNELYNLDGLSDTELHHYLKTFLSKAPTMDGMDEQTRPSPCKDINEVPTNDQPKEKGRRSSFHKPPWKS